MVLGFLSTQTHPGCAGLSVGLYISPEAPHQFWGKSAYLHFWQDHGDSAANKYPASPDYHDTDRFNRLNMFIMVL